MTKRFIPVLAACLFLMVGTAQAATSLAFPPPDTNLRLILQLILPLNLLHIY